MKTQTTDMFDSTPVHHWRAFFWATAVGWAALIFIGSWYPFRFASFDLWEAVGLWQSQTLAQVSKSDFAVNFLVGGPLGFFCWLAISPINRRWLSMLTAILTTISVLVFVSTSVEIVQSGMSTRTPSWIDTAAQILGGCLGMVIAIISQRALLNRFEKIFVTTANGQPSDRPGGRLRAALEIYLFGYTVWMLMPFIPAISPSELKEKLNSGMVQFNPFHAWDDDPWQAAYTALAATVSAIPVGLWFGIRFGNPPDRRRNALTTMLTALLAASIGVVLLEACQLAIQTRTMSTADMIWSAFGATMGVGIYSYWNQSSLQEPDRVRAPVANSGFLFFFLLTVAYTMLYVMLAMAPFEWVGSKAEALARIEDLKTNGWRSGLSGNDWGLITNSIRTALWSLPLGALCAMTWKRSPDAVRWFVAAVIVIGVVGLCCGTELIQLFLIDRSASLIGMLVRLAAAGMGAILGLATMKTKSTRQAIDKE